VKPDCQQLAQPLFIAPLAITPDKLEIVMTALADRFELMQRLRGDGELVIFEGDYESGEAAQERSYEMVEGVAIVPVQGRLSRSQARYTCIRV
jgi:capsid assembly protease